MPSKDMDQTRKIKIKKLKLRKNAGTTLDINPSKEKVPREKKNKEPKNKALRKKILKICLFVLIALFVVGIGIVLWVLNDVIGDTDSVDLAELQNLKLATVVYDKDGKEIGRVHSGENRIVVNYEDLPKYLVDAVVSIEDERFWTHNGVDLKRTSAAIATYIINRGHSSFGGSTITQQLIKTVTEDNESSWKRKIREWYRAINLEKVISKEDILTAYLNKIYLGEGASGIEIASQTYFAKSVKDINIAEAACLAAAIQQPEGTNPYRGEEYKEKLIVRQKVVLDKMLSLKKITQEEYDAALKYELQFKKAEIINNAVVQSYAVDAVLEAVAKDIASQKNITYESAMDMVYSNGYKIYSTIDSKVQESINKQTNNAKLFYKNKDGSMMQCAMVVLNNKDGSVAGLMGGVGEKTGAFDFNRATDANRQPGSTFKPIAAYGPAFEAGVSYPGMGVDDSPLNVNGYRPVNYYGYYNGYVTVRNAIKLSMNIPAVRTLMKVDLDYAFQFAKNTGITTLKASNKNLSMALGSVDATVIDMATAYGTFANGGVYSKPNLYTKVLNSSDKEILAINKTYTKVMKSTTAYLITDCLRTVVTSGTGTSARFSSKIQIAGKTGNTNDDKDQWFIGYTPYYTAAVWNGYDKPRAIGYRKIGSYPYTATVVFTNVMKEIHSGLAAASFTKPKEIVSASICTVSGLVATDACKADTRKGIIVTEIFASGTVPTDTCNIHKLVEVCSVSGKLPTEFCHLYGDLKEISVITRDGTGKTSDSKYLMPKEKCTLHTAEPKVEEPVVEEPDPTNPSTPTTSTDQSGGETPGVGGLYQN